MARLWAILQADTDAARVAAKQAGCTHAVVNVSWGEIQPTATGSVDATVIARIKSDYAHCKSIGLKVILSINIHYPPSWVLSNIEKYKDQGGFEYTTTNVGLGKAVRNWVWTQTGRTNIADLISRIGTALTTAERAQTWGCRVGGGWYGELHYAEKSSASTVGSYAWQGFGASMQNGTDLASDLTVCPLPGYIPYGTGSTDANDSIWLNWYLNGLVTFATWLIAQHKAAGFTKNLFLLLPGYGVRLNQVRTSGGYKQAASLGEDPTRAIGAIMMDKAVWPYSTWMNTADGFAGGVVDSDKSAWKSLYEKALVRNKHTRLVGENTGNESNSGMDAIFSGALSNGSYAGYPGAPPTNHYYNGILWLGYGDLNAGGSKATMANFATDINSAAP